MTKDGCMLHFYAGGNLFLSIAENFEWIKPFIVTDD